jgi:hypothetical protein
LPAVQTSLHQINIITTSEIYKKNKKKEEEEHKREGMKNATYSYLADLNGGRCAREARQTGLEGGHLAERAATTGVDAGHSELVGGAWLKLLLLQVAVVWHVHHVDVLHRQLSVRTMSALQQRPVSTVQASMNNFNTSEVEREEHHQP